MPSSDGSDERSTHFLFEHSVFRTPDAKFVIGGDGEPSMVVRLADLDAVLPLQLLRHEFDLTRTDDNRVLDKVVSGLKYVKTIRPGDSIPKELLDGTASWSVEDRHHDIAKGRITMQISGWLTGKEQVISDHESLLQLAGDPAIKTRVSEAFGEIAKKLGLPPDQRQEVIDRIDYLVRELAYIEALRDRFGVIKQLAVKVGNLRNAYRRDRVQAEELLRVGNLIMRPIRELADIFDQLDAQSGEVIAVLRNLERQVNFIRQTRDEVHGRMMMWDDTLQEWETIEVARSPETEQSIKSLYRFLARNFSVEKPWHLVAGRS